MKCHSILSRCIVNPFSGEKKHTQKKQQKKTRKNIKFLPAEFPEIIKCLKSLF